MLPQPALIVWICRARLIYYHPPTHTQKVAVCLLTQTHLMASCLLPIVISVYCTTTTCDLVNAMATFKQLLSITQNWWIDELSVFLYLINGVFEEFRDTTLEDILTGSHINLRCSLEDHPFREMLYEKQERRIKRLQRSAPTFNSIVGVRVSADRQTTAGNDRVDAFSAS